MNWGGPEMIVVLVIVLLLFGGTQLPKLARSLGQAKKEFEQGSTEPDGSSSPSADGGTTA